MQKLQPGLLVQSIKQKFIHTIIDKVLELLSNSVIVVHFILAVGRFSGRILS